MPKFNDYTFFRYAFGDKTEDLTDRSLERGLRLLASKLVADELLKNNTDVYGHAVDYLKKAHKNIVQWINDDYKTALKNNLSFLTENPDVFYESPDQAWFRQQLNDYTRNKETSDGVLASDLLNYYYESGAFLYTKDNKDAHRYDKFIDINDPNLHLSDDMRKTLRRQKINLESIYPTKEQLKTAYREYVLRGKNALGLEKTLFTNMPKAEKRAIIAENTSEALQANAYRKFRKVFNMQNLTREEKDTLWKRERHIDYDSLQEKYNSGLIYKKYHGESFDKENLKEAIEIVRSMKEIHDSRPGWQRFFGYFGTIGKENQVIRELSEEIVRKGIPEADLAKVLNGDKDAERKVLATVPTREERLEFEKTARKAEIEAMLDMDEDNLDVRQRGEAEFRIVYKNHFEGPEADEVILTEADAALFFGENVKDILDKKEPLNVNKVGEDLAIKHYYEGDDPKEMNINELNGADEEEIAEIHGYGEEVEEFNLTEDDKKELEEDFKSLDK